MSRPRRNCRVAFDPKITYFKPRGVPLINIEEVCLTIEEIEAIRLADYESLNHEESSQIMGISRSTFGRILGRARKAVAQSIIDGKALKIEGGNYEIN